MARIDTLGNFLTDVADAIRTKTGSSEPIQASSFDTAIENIPSGGSIDDYIYTEITENTGSDNTMSYKIVKTVPVVTVADAVTSLDYAYYYLYSSFAPILECNDNVISMYALFWGCLGPTEINLSHLDTSNVTDMRYLVAGIAAVAANNIDTITSIVFGNNFDTSKVTRYDSMFQYRKKITSLDLSSFTTAQNVQTSTMFDTCTSLAYLDMRNFDFTKITVSTRMFGSSAGFKNDCEIIVADQTQKNWLVTNFSKLTNVKTVAEYEAE